MSYTGRFGGTLGSRSYYPRRRITYRRRYPMYRGLRVRPFTRMRPRYPGFRMGAQYPELKYVDSCQVGAYVYAALPAFRYVIPLYNGTAAFGNRVGSEVLVKSIFVKLYGFSQSGTSANINRMLLFYDR